jgi:thioredoxin-dependent peroxiredoxin
MAERTGVITFKGNGMTLVGENPPAVGKPAPAFKVTGNDLSDVELIKYRGKVVILSVVPSLDTGVCDTMTRRFNQEATQLSDDVVVLTVSMDLPFAQKRWCGAAGVTRVTTLSDYKHRSFGPAYGLLIKELGLLTRAVFVIDQQGVVRYEEIVKEVTKEPDYNAALQVAKSLV